MCRQIVAPEFLLRKSLWRSGASLGGQHRNLEKISRSGTAPVALNWGVRCAARLVVACCTART